MRRNKRTVAIRTISRWGSVGLGAASLLVLATATTPAAAKGSGGGTGKGGPGGGGKGGGCGHGGGGKKGGGGQGGGGTTGGTKPTGSQTVSFTATVKALSNNNTVLRVVTDSGLTGDVVTSAPSTATVGSRITVTGNFDGKVVWAQTVTSAN